MRGALQMKGSRTAAGCMIYAAMGATCGRIA